MIEEKISHLFSNKIVIVILVLVISVIIYYGLKKIINNRVGTLNKKDERRYRKKKTYLNLLNSICKYLILIVDIIIILTVYGINVSSIVTGLGVVSVITGLALQDAFKDIIAGFNIIVDGYFSVGDTVKIDEVEGKVIDIELKTTKIKDMCNDNILVLANRNISKSLNLSHLVDIDIPLPYEEKTEKIEEIIDSIVSLIKENKNVEKAEYKGVQEFGDSAIYYKIRFWCKPDVRLQTRRDCLRIIKLQLDKNNVEIPYTQIDVHQK